MIKQLKTNKLLRKAIENKETRAALINAMNALIKELDQKLRQVETEVRDAFKELDEKPEGQE